MVGSLARLLSIVSLTLCAIVIASFAIFVIDETKSGSAHQEQQVNASTGQAPAPAPAPPAAGSKKGSVHRAIDDAASEITSPFADVVSASNGEWAVRGADLGLALAIYGFGLGFVARMVRLRV